MTGRNMPTKKGGCRAKEESRFLEIILKIEDALKNIVINKNVNSIQKCWYFTPYYYKVILKQ